MKLDRLKLKNFSIGSAFASRLVSAIPATKFWYLDVGRRVLVVLDVRLPDEDRIDERDLRQGAVLRVGHEVLHGHEVPGHVVPDVGELEGERDLRDVDLPADARLVEEVEDGALGELGG